MKLIELIRVNNPFVLSQTRSRIIECKSAFYSANISNLRSFFEILSMIESLSCTDIWTQKFPLNDANSFTSSFMIAQSAQKGKSWKLKIELKFLWDETQKFCNLM